LCRIRQTCLKTLIIFLFFSYLYGGGNIYSYVVFKTQESEIKYIFSYFLKPEKIDFIYKKPVKITNHPNPYSLFTNIEITKKPSVDMGVEVDLNSLNLKPKIYIFHDYNSTIITQNTISKIYYNNILSLNFHKNRFLRNIKELFTYFAKYIPKYSYTAQKYDFIYENCKNSSILIPKPAYIDISHLKNVIKKLKQKFLSEITDNYSDMQKIKAKLKIYVTKETDDEYATMSLNLKYPLKKDNSLKIAKLNLINSFNQKVYKIYSLADSINQSYIRYRQYLNDINFNIKSINYDLLKIKHGLVVNPDTLASKYLKIYDTFYKLNDLSYNNQNQYLQFFTLLKELNEY